MKKSKEILTVLCCLLLTITFAFAQGKGQGQGKGLLNDTGCENGKGFTIGQGHLTGKSAVDCIIADPCLDEAIAQAEIWIDSFEGSTLLNTTTTSSTTFVIYWHVIDRNGRDKCNLSDFEAMGDPNTGCTYIQIGYHTQVDCP